MIAAKGGYQAIVELLLSQEGIDVIAKDIAGTTALYAAAAQGDKDIMKLLLAHTEIDLGSEDDKGAEHPGSSRRHGTSACKGRECSARDGRDGAEAERIASDVEASACSSPGNGSGTSRNGLE
ncbi:MAG: hypothetical protein ASARMPRED_003799 [Alectoria sarmentosa]|nr:MAG: hypothetical protein ASARMPRED_003799 [Alectoria sarmentosa]